MLEPVVGFVDVIVQTYLVLLCSMYVWFIFMQAISLPVRVSTSAMLPNFQHDVKGKLPFVVVNKKNCSAGNAPSEVNESDEFDSPDGYGRNSENRLVAVHLSFSRAGPPTQWSMEAFRVAR